MWVGSLPAVLVVGLTVPSVDGLPVGMGEALGCSGGPNLAPPQWTSLGLMMFFETTGEVAVATDGFFAIVAGGHDLSVEAARAQLRVVVTDQGGADVPGDVSVLRSDGYGSHVFGWAAREPLAVGAVLTATLAVDAPTDGKPGIGGQYPLRVVGAPTPPPAPHATFSRWGTVYHDDPGSELVSCRATEPCGPAQVLDVRTRVVEQVSAFAEWSPPEIVGGVAWSIRLEPKAPEGEAAGEQLWFGALGGYRQSFDSPMGGLPIFEIGSVDFRDRAQRYCVDVILEDLRTGLEQRSELCSAPGALERFGNPAGISRCDEPPSAELTPLWCQLKPDASAYRVCDAYRAQADAGSASVNAPTTPDEPTAGASTFGCAMSATRPGAAAFVALAGLALASIARRWRRPARAGSVHVEGRATLKASASSSHRPSHLPRTSSR